jgi:hypothetical protein
MAILIPNILKESSQSRGETLIFNYFKKDQGFTKDWIILHSLDIAQHRKKKRGEADFILLIPNKGILCVEVKAYSQISRKEGVWFFGEEKSESPFDQVRDNSEAIIKQIRELSLPYKTFVTNVVIFTHCPFKEKSIEWNDWELIDYDEIKINEGNIAKIVLKHFDESIKHHQSKPGKYNYLNDKNYYDEFTKESAVEISNYFRKDFECFVSPSDLTNDLDKEMKSFSNEQYRVIDANEDNKLILVDGYAGSGKTILALELARRKALEGKNVLFLYFNRLIKNKIEDQIGLINETVKDDINSKKISIFTLYEFFSSFTPSTEQPISIKSQSNSDSFSLLLLNHLMKSELNNKYDVLIIDEVQDFPNDELGKCSLDVFNQLNLDVNSNVLSELYFFGDFRSQQVYFDQLSRNKFNEKYFDKRLHSLILNENCRNPLRISRFAELVGKIKYSKIFREDNLHNVEKYFYKNKADQIKILKNIIKKYITKFRPSDIAILFYSNSSKNSKNISVEDFDDELVELLGLKNSNIIKNGEVINKNFKKTLGYATSIRKFKGLESKICIIVNIGDFDPNKSPAILYTGVTRAQYNLMLLFDEKDKDQWGKYLI